jgi:hypothetical protein
MLLLAVAASVKTRNYVAAFNESRNIAFAVYNIALIGGASYTVANSIDNVQIAYQVRVIGLFVTCITVTFVIALPPLHTIKYYPQLNTPAAWITNNPSTIDGTFKTVADAPSKEKQSADKRLSKKISSSVYTES